MVSASGRAKCITRSARERNASSIASMKLVVVTKSTDGRLRAIASMPSITASVARCTSTGLVSNEALVRRTAKLSTSSISTTVCGRRAASSGIVSWQQPHDVALAFAEHVAREGVRVDLDERRRAFPRERERRHLREAARQGGLAGARRAGEHDQAVRQARELRELAAVLAA